MATTTTTTIARPTRTGRALAALLGSAIAVTAAYHVTRPLPSQDPITATPTASTATVDPFQVMGDLTPIVSAQMASTATVDPFQVMGDLTPIVSAQMASTATVDPFQVMGDLTPIVSAQMASSAIAPDSFVGDDASKFGEHGLTGFAQEAVGRLDQP